MAEQVNVPAVGKVDRKWVLAGGAAVAGIVVYAYWRRSQAPAVEPGSEEQLEDAGYVPSDWSPDAFVGATAPGGETYDPQLPLESVTTNAEWSQRVVDLLEGVGYERNKAAATVGKYLSGQPLDTTEKLIIQTALALLGNPPAGALPIITAPSTPTTNPAAPTSTALQTPTLRYSAGDPRNTNYALAWTKIPGAAYYIVKRSSGPGAPTTIAVIGTSRRTPALQRGATYGYQVRAIAVPPRTSSGWSNTVRFTVPRK